MLPTKEIRNQIVEVVRFEQEAFGRGFSFAALSKLPGLSLSTPGFPRPLSAGGVELRGERPELDRLWVVSIAAGESWESQQVKNLEPVPQIEFGPDQALRFRVC